MKPFTRLRSVGALALVATLVSGCAMTTPTMQAWEGTSAMVSWTDQSGMDALLTGEVTIDSGCWAVTDDDGTLRPVIWPKGTTLDDEGLHIPGLGEALAPGTMVDVGGGEVGTSDLGDLPGCWDPGTLVFLSWNVTPSR